MNERIYPVFGFTEQSEKKEFNPAFRSEGFFDWKLNLSQGGYRNLLKALEPAPMYLSFFAGRRPRKEKKRFKRTNPTNIYSEFITGKIISIEDDLNSRTGTITYQVSFNPQEYE